MRRILKILFYIISFFGFILICLLIYLDGFGPAYEGDIIIADINVDVETIYDAHGVPHIYAQNSHDGFFALGYVQAQERLFQMEVMKRLASGRLSEVFGESLLETDMFFRMIGIDQRAGEIAEDLSQKADEPYVQNLNSYLAGVNYYVEHGKTPFEFLLLGIEKENFTIKDVHLFTGYLSFSFSIGAHQDPLLNKMLIKLGPEYMEDFALETIPGTTVIPVYQPKDEQLMAEIAEKFYKIQKGLFLPVLTGSNGWVIGPSKTKTGKVILSNDTHVGFTQPAVWYDSHIETPQLSLYGNYLAGFPYPLIGHTRDIAWGLTMFENDDLDFIRLDTDPVKKVYRYGNEWLPFQKRNEVFKVKDKPNVTMDVLMTRYGPVVNRVLDDLDSVETGPVACWWAYTHVQNNELEALHSLSNSKNIDGVHQTASLIESPGLNLMYGDKDGNIGWWGVAKLVNRNPGINSHFVVPGNDSIVTYDNFYSFDINPKAINPPEGYVYSANNQADSIDGKFYPGYYAPEYRASRIVQLISRENKWDIEKVKGAINDDISPIHPKIGKMLIALIEDDIRAESEKIYELLENWDGSHSGNSVEPSIYYRWIYQILSAAMADEMGNDDDLHALINTHMMKASLPLIFKNGNSIWWDNIHTDKKETRNDIVRNAFIQAITGLKKQLGNDVAKWEWGKIHQLEHKHPIGLQKPFNLIFNVGPNPVPGGIEVINNLAFNLEDPEIYNVTYGPAMRSIVDFTDIENSISVSPTGQSGFFMSPFYTDQVDLYNSGKFRKQLMNRKDIEENTYGTFTFIAGK